jgi:hypothetical protein
LVACLLEATPAYADTYEALLVRAVVARDRALDTGTAQDWQEALILFQSVVEVRPTKEAKFEFAEAAQHLHLDDEAYAAYRDALDLGLRGRAEERARSYVLAHLHDMAELNIEGPNRTLVFIADRRRAVLPLLAPLVVSAGVVRVRLQTPEAREWQGVATIAPGTLTTLHPDFAPDGARAPESILPGGAKAVAEDDSRSRSAPRWALPVALAGAGLALAGGVAIVLTSIQRNDEQALLSRDCAVFRGNDCALATPTKVNSAQAEADQIAGLETARGIAIGATAAGLVAIAAGVVPLLAAGARARRGVGPAAWGIAGILVTEHSMGIRWRAEF